MCQVGKDLLLILPRSQAVYARLTPKENQTLVFPSPVTFLESRSFLKYIPTSSHPSPRAEPEKISSSVGGLGIGRMFQSLICAVNIAQCGNATPDAGPHHSVYLYMSMHACLALSRRHIGPHDIQSLPSNNISSEKSQRCYQVRIFGHHSLRSNSA